MPEKLDLKSLYKDLYSAKPTPSLVSVPRLCVLAVDGQGDPNGSQRFQDCVQALYAASFSLKFAMKKERGIDWGVMMLEGDWCAADMAAFSMERRTEWRWTLCITQPEFVGPAEAAAAVAAASAKKGASAALADLRLEQRAPEEAAHILHLGSYDCEAPTITKLHAFIKEGGLVMSGKHREIYLSDARRVAPEKLRTIIRQPVSR